MDDRDGRDQFDGFDDMEDLELRDDELAGALRRHADRLTGPLDAEAALETVHRRGRTYRRRRLVATTFGAAAAAALVVAGLVVVSGDDRELLRAPATQPALPSDPAPSTPSTGPSTVASPSTSMTTTPAPPTTVAPGTPPSTPASSPASTPASTAPYSSRGGDIRVRLDDGTIALAEPPAPEPGWTALVQDDGPTRVRVRFERGDERAEIRVDLEGGRLVPRIT